MLTIRTDLAAEARDLWRESAGETTRLPGVRARDEEALGLPVAVVDAPRHNRKLTSPEDLVVVEAALLAAEREGE